MNDERSMAAGDFRYLRLHTLGKKLLGLRCDHLVLGGDHEERRLVAPGGDSYRCLVRLDTQRKLMVRQGFGDLQGKISRDRRRKHLWIDVEVAFVVRMNRRGTFGY